VTIENSENFMAEEYEKSKIIAGESIITMKQVSYTQRMSYVR
jgi:hypothetical protein